MNEEGNLPARTFNADLKSFVCNTAVSTKLHKQTLSCTLNHGSSVCSIVAANFQRKRRVAIIYKQVIIARFGVEIRESELNSMAGNNLPGTSYTIGVTRRIVWSYYFPISVVFGSIAGCSDSVASDFKN